MNRLMWFVRKYILQYTSLIAKLTATVFKFETTEAMETNDHISLDEDGDFDLQRKEVKHKEVVICRYINQSSI